MKHPLAESRRPACPLTRFPDSTRSYSGVSSFRVTLDLAQRLKARIDPRMMMPMKSPCEESAAGAVAVQPRHAEGPWVLIATILASSMAFIDGTVVNVALPALQAALHASVTDIQWVVESYALLLASLLLLGGSLGDLYGRRKIFLSGVAAVCNWINLVRPRAPQSLRSSSRADFKG